MRLYEMDEGGRLRLARLLADNAIVSRDSERVRRGGVADGIKATVAILFGGKEVMEIERTAAILLRQKEKEKDGG